MAAQRHVRQLIQLAGCEGLVRIAGYAEDRKHFSFVLENPATKLTGKLTMSHGGASRSGKEMSLRGSNLHLIRMVAGTRKSA